MPTHNLFVRYDDQPSVTVAKTAGLEVSVEEAIPANSTNLQIVGVTCDQSQLKSVYLKSDKALTLKTNSTGAPQDTISLVADSPIVWNDDMPAAACPFAGDVTALYVTEGAGVDANLVVKLLQDPTP